MSNPLIDIQKCVPCRLHEFTSLRQTRASLKRASWRLLLAITSVILFASPAVHAQTGSTTQYLFVIQTSDILTYIVDGTTGALTAPTGVNPAPMRAIPAGAAVVNPAGTLLFVASINSSQKSAVSVFSISSTGALTELTASPFSAGDSSSPGVLAMSPDGQYLYASSKFSDTNPNNPVLDVYSIGTGGALTPVGNYQLPFGIPLGATFLYMHPTGLWLYAYGKTVFPLHQLAALRQLRSLP